MSFIKRLIQITITLGTGQFGDDKGNTVVLSGHRTLVSIAAFGGDSQGEAQVRIFGLSLDIINQLTTIGPIMTEIRGKNLIDIAAGDENGTLSTIYKGTILNAWGDFKSAPDVGLNIIAYAAMRPALAPVDPTSYEGGANVSDIMQSLATKAQLNFINHDVNVVLSSPYLPGSALDQIRDCANAAGIDYIIENGTLSIWPRGGFRDGEIPVVSPQSGMIGYPTFSSQGVLIQTEFLPTARVGGKITVENSEIIMANGTWVIFQASHEISSELPDGPWFSSLEVWNRDGK